ncbi:MAG: phage major capsid protein [Lysobacter sp.]|nr:phage major capsid protein [Lysobacter sp.]
MRYQSLLKERDELIVEGKNLFEAAEKGGRDLTETEKTRDDEINARLEVLGADIKREEVRRERERATPAAAVTSVRERAEDDPRRGFRDLADFALAVRQASVPGAYAIDERLRIGAAPTNFHQETGGTGGEGYAIPPQLREDIFTLVFQGDDLLSLVNKEPTNSNAVELLADDSTPWGSTGIQAAWRAEGIQMTPSRLLTNARQVRLHELYAFTLATEELLQDLPRLNARLTSGAARAINWKASEAIFRGTGSGQPLGIQSAGALVVQAKETGQATLTVQPQNIAKMFSRVINPGMSVWLLNQDVLPQLFTMTLGNYPIYMPPTNGFAEAPGGFLLGRPVKINEHCASLTNQGDINLVNLEGYYAAQRDAMQAAESMHLYFDYGIRAFRWTFRFGGEPFLSAPVSPANGTNTRSHFVTLAAR